MEIANDMAQKRKMIVFSNIPKDKNESKNPQKEVRRGINMTDSQKEIAQKIREDIKKLYNEGFSIRMITNHYNELYSIRNQNGEIVKEAISRETVRKVLNNKEVSLKSIIGNPNFQF